MIKNQSMFTNIELEFLKTLVGKKFDSFFCDKFTFNTMAYGIIYFKIGTKEFSITNLQEPIDCLGDIEDGGVFKINYDVKERKSLLENIELIKHSVNSKIKNIYIVNDKQSIESNNELYEYETTVGFIFEVEDNYQIGFERTVFFSEDINVIQGYEIVNKFVSVDELLEQYDKEYNPKCSREIIKIN